MTIFNYANLCRKGNTCCPIDNKLLIECEMFMDKVFRRGIRQTCSNAIIQCRDDQKHTQNQMASSVLEIKQINCPFKACGCDFETNATTLLDAHSENHITTHLNVST